MAEISRNSKENYFEVYKGFHKSRFAGELERIPVKDSNLEMLKSRKKIIGARFKNFYEKIEIASYYAENELKKILERNKFFSIYLGMHFELDEKDKSFYLNIGNTRPDFLVNLPGVGNVFIDVKCRKLLTFQQDAETGDNKKDNKENDEAFKLCFNINKNEVHQLLQIEQKLNIPVWLAFKDYNCFNYHKKEYSDQDFYLIPVSDAVEYIEKLDSALKKYSKLFYSYRIPVDALTKTAKLSSIRFHTDFDADLIKKMAEISILALSKIKKEILNLVSTEKVYKTYLPYILSGNELSNSKFKGKLAEFTPQDINSVLWYLIDKGELHYRKEKYLKINTEKIGSDQPLSSSRSAKKNMKKKTIPSLDSIQKKDNIKKTTNL